MAHKIDTFRSSRRGKFLTALGLGARKQPSAPAGIRIYAIGDIHGCDVLLARLLAKIEDDSRSCTGRKIIVCLGDYVDRGPDSRGVVERLIATAPEGFEIHYLKGNHDAAVLDFLANAETYRAWRTFGAPETLLSYGVRPPLFDSREKFAEARDEFAERLPSSHLAFLRSLEKMVVLGDYAFVHAGIRPGLKLETQSEEDLLWIREEFLNSETRHDKMIVHGHTPGPRPLLLHNRIAVDTGAYATGVLSCAVLEGTDCRFIQAT